MKMIILILINLYFSLQSSSFQCGHNSMYKNKTIQFIDIGTTTNNLRNLESTYHPIRFHIDYSIINTRNLVDSTYISNIKTLFDRATNILSKLLEVNNEHNITIKEPFNCYDSIIPSQSQNIDADVVIYPEIITLEEFGGDYLASAGSCLLDKTNKRPLVGLVSLRADYNFTKANSFNYLEMLLLHEITHILVFHNYLFDYFPTQPATTTQIVDGIERTFLITPNVIKMAQRHFGCDTLIGLELENQGLKGTVGSHWEGRLMSGDYMIPSLLRELVISDITLALFQDSGWYKVHYYSGGLFRYGKDEGCSFLEEKCIKNGIVSFPKEFCNKKGEKKCLGDNSSKGFCAIWKYDELIPEEYRYFENNTLGGYFYGDYCPIVQYYSEYDDEKSYSCKFGKKDNYPPELEEVISDTSICIESSLTKKDDATLLKYKDTFRPICHQVFCDKEKKEIIIKIGATSVTCPRDISTVTVEGYDGMIKCPDYSRICGGTVWCSDPGECVDKKSSSLLVNGIIISTPSENESNKSSSSPINSTLNNSSVPSIILLQFLIIFDILFI